MRTIRSKISSLVIWAVVISVLTLGVISIYFLSRSGNEYANELLQISCSNSEKQIDAYFDSIEQCVDTVAYSVSEDMDNLSDKELHEYLRRAQLMFHTVVKNNNGIITYYYRMDPSLNKKEKGFWFERDQISFREAELTDIEAYDPDDVEHVGWFYIPKEKGLSMWLEPYINKNLNDTMMISYVAPAFWKGRFIGVVGIDYDYNALIKHLTYNGTFKNAYAFLTDAKDKIIYHPDLEIGTDLSTVADKLVMRKNMNDSSVVQFEADGVKKRASWRVLSNNMVLYFVVPESDITAVWTRMIMYFVLAALLITLVFVVVTTSLAGRMTIPLRNLTEAARKLNRGDYNVELDYDGDDEIGLLTGSFRGLVKHLDVYISDLNDMAYKDALTSVRNKAAFDLYVRKIDDRIGIMDKDRMPRFAICMFDCNDLKVINDNYGHDKGDIYIKKSCALICDIFNHSPVFRLGGDEFVCILENDELDNRVRLCTAFDNAVREMYEKGKNPWDKVVIASGIAIFNPDLDKGSDDVLKRADKRMYEDKQRKKAGIETVKIQAIEY